MRAGKNILHHWGGGVGARKNIEGKNTFSSPPDNIRYFFLPPGKNIHRPPNP